MLFLMAFVTLLPIGAMQAWIAFKEGYWVAHSADFFAKGTVVFLGTFRAIPDTIIIVLGFCRWRTFSSQPIRI